MTTPTRESKRYALSQADSILKAKGRTFHWARSLLGTIHAARATRLYAFCRYVDDLADLAVSPQDAGRRLAEVKRAIVSGESADPVVGDALDLMNECRLEPVWLLELIRGVESDLDAVLMPDEEALLRYCYRVAGTVGLMMCRVLDVDQSAALPHAIDLGIAMQLTNICRDVTEDALAGRRYLPATLVGNLAPASLIDPLDSLRPRLRLGVAALLDRADRYYRSGERGLSYLPARARGGILVAARTYQAIGVRLRRREYAYWKERVVVPGRTKALLTARAVLALSLRKSFWRPAGPHEDALHAALDGLPGAAGPHVAAGSYAG